MADTLTPTQTLLADMKKMLDDTFPAEPEPKATPDPANTGISEEVAKSISDMAGLMKSLFAPGDDKGEGRGSIVQKLAEIDETVGTHGDVIEKLLTGLSGETVRKSINGDDNEPVANGGDGGAPVVTKAKASDDMTKASGHFDGIIRGLAANPGRRAVLN